MNSTRTCEWRWESGGDALEWAWMCNGHRAQQHKTRGGMVCTSTVSLSRITRYVKRVHNISQSFIVFSSFTQTSGYSVPLCDNSVYITAVINRCRQHLQWPASHVHMHPRICRRRPSISPVDQSILSYPSFQYLLVPSSSSKSHSGKCIIRVYTAVVCIYLGDTTTRSGTSQDSDDAGMLTLVLLHLFVFWAIQICRGEKMCEFLDDIGWMYASTIYRMRSTRIRHTTGASHIPIHPHTIGWGLLTSADMHSDVHNYSGIYWWAFHVHA